MHTTMVNLIQCMKETRVYNERINRCYCLSVMPIDGKVFLTVVDIKEGMYFDEKVMRDFMKTTCKIPKNIFPITARIDFSKRECTIYDKSRQGTGKNISRIISELKGKDVDIAQYVADF